MASTPHNACIAGLPGDAIRAFVKERPRNFAGPAGLSFAIPSDASMAFALFMTMRSIREADDAEPVSDLDTPPAPSAVDTHETRARDARRPCVLHEEHA